VPIDDLASIRRRHDTAVFLKFATPAIEPPGNGLFLFQKIGMWQRKLPALYSLKKITHENPRANPGHGRRIAQFVAP
jgi:hypothetical protein